jgi:hypothetical protein
VIGVVKGGTTSLYNYLSQHPQVFLPSIKETNHFAKADIDPKNFDSTYARDVDIDLDKYLNSGSTETIHIAHVNDPEHYQALFERVKDEKAIGEISNSYMICPSAAAAIHEYNRNAKIVVILRNPIYRAWSQFLMNLREAKVSVSDFIQEVRGDHDRQIKGWGVNHQYLELGNYARQLKQYIDLFGRENVLVLIHDDYRKDPEHTLNKLSGFLGIDTNFTFDFSERSNTSSLPKFAGLNKFLVRTGLFHFLKNSVSRSTRQKVKNLFYSNKSMPELQRSERDWLVECYREEVKELSELLQKDMSAKWIEFKEQ